jgi:hypothetical protein
MQVFVIIFGKYMEKLTAEDKKYKEDKIKEYGITPIHIKKMEAIIKNEAKINLERFLEKNKLLITDLAEMCLINYANLLHFFHLGYSPVLAIRSEPDRTKIITREIKFDPRYIKRKFDPTNYPNQYKVAFKIMMEIPSPEHHFLCYTFCMVDRENKKILRVVDEGPLLGLQEEISII